MGGCRAAVPVPGLIGFSLKDARIALALAGLGAVLPQRCPKSSGHRGVVAQSPKRASMVPKRFPVRLCLAKAHGS